MAERAELARARLVMQATPASALLAALEGTGEQARIVGGAVRNAMLDLPVADIDIATTRLPADVTELARERGWKAIPTGIEHGTVTVIIDGAPFEVTTLREDIATDGRHAVVRFGRNFEQDAARRDFTINALSIGRDGEVHDYFGGLDDLAERRVRFIGDPDQRLREDYLRGLRFLRFSAEYAEGSLDGAGLAAVDRQKHGFSGLSAERIRQEMLKLLVARRAGEVVSQAEERGLISLLLGGEANPERFRAVAERDSARDSMLRLFAIAVRGSADIARLRDRLRLSNAEIARLVALEAGHSHFMGGADLREIAYRLPECLESLAALLPASFGHTDVERSLRLAALRVDPPIFLLSGADVLAKGLQPGPLVGQALAEAKTAWIAAGFPGERVPQERLLDEAIARLKAT